MSDLYLVKDIDGNDLHDAHGFEWVSEAWIKKPQPPDVVGWLTEHGYETHVCFKCDGEGTDGFDRNGSHAAGEYREFTCGDCDGSGRVLVVPVGEDT